MPENNLLAKSVLLSQHYACCMTYNTKTYKRTDFQIAKHKNAKFVKIDGLLHLHICNICPIMVGSKLDILFSNNENAIIDRQVLDSIDNSYIANICEERDFVRVSESFPIEVFGSELKNKLLGHFFISGEIVVIPFIMENNRENLHFFKDGKTKLNYWRFFLYNTNNNGFKFEYCVNTDKFSFRNKRGEIKSEGQDISKDVDFKKEFMVDDKHIIMNTVWIKDVIKTLMNNGFNIDDMENKWLLSTVNILFRLFIKAQKNPKEAAAILANGDFSRLVSSNVQYMGKDDKNSSTQLKATTTSNQYRRPLSMQVMNADLISQATKLTQEQIKLKKRMPDNLVGFICPYDFNTNIKNFAKNYNVVHDVEFIAYTDLNVLNTVLETLLIEGFIGRAFDENSLPQSDKMQCLIKLLPTPYAPIAKFKSIFYRVKAINSGVEIKLKRKYIIFDISLGTPLKRYKNIRLTPYELTHYFKRLTKSPDFEITSLSGLKFKANHHYESKERSISSTSYAKSKISTENEQMAFFFSNEVYCSFLGDGNKFKKEDEKRLNLTEDGHFSMDVLFAGIPEINEDTYVVDSAVDFNICICKKYNYEFDVKSDVQITPTNLKTASRFITNAYGEIEEWQIKLFTIYSETNLASLYYGKILCLPRGNNVYDFYKTLNDSSLLKVPLDQIKTSIDIRHNVTKGVDKLEILIYLTYHTPFIDGLKMANYCGEKGLVWRKDLSDFKTADGKSPQVIMSLYSYLSRFPLPQLIEMAKNGFETVYFDGKPIGKMGKCKFFVLKNSASEIKMNGLMKIDILTTNAFNMNNLNGSLYCKIQNCLHSDEKFCFFPRANQSLLSLYSLQKTKINILNYQEPVYKNNLKELISICQEFEMKKAKKRKRGKGISESE
ncbi:MAG: hypothetical protein ACRYGG_09015 [Janthinobacterium lividum]